jgi:hypothetical protein
VDVPMVVACFCGYTDFAMLDGDVALCGHCGRQVHPPETVVPDWLQQAVREVLDRCEPWDDTERPVIL